MVQRAVRSQMAAERLSMRNTREILRQKWTLGRSHRRVAQSLGLGLGTVSGVGRQARAVGLDWAQIEALSEDGLAGRPSGPPVSRDAMAVVRVRPDSFHGDSNYTILPNPGRKAIGSRPPIS